MLASKLFLARRGAPPLTALRRTADFRQRCFSDATPTPAEFCAQAIASGPVVVFSRGWCPFCKQLETLFGQAVEPDLRVAKFVDLEKAPGGFGDEVQDYLVELTGSRSVPKVYIGGELVGGCDDTMGLFNSDKLEPQIQAAVIKDMTE